MKLFTRIKILLLGPREGGVVPVSECKAFADYVGEKGIEERNKAIEKALTPYTPEEIRKARLVNALRIRNYAKGFELRTSVKDGKKIVSIVATPEILAEMRRDAKEEMLWRKDTLLDGEYPGKRSKVITDD